MRACFEGEMQEAICNFQSSFLSGSHPQRLLMMLSLTTTGPSSRPSASCGSTHKLQADCKRTRRRSSALVMRSGRTRRRSCMLALHTLAVQAKRGRCHRSDTSIQAHKPYCECGIEQHGGVDDLLLSFLASFHPTIPLSLRHRAGLHWVDELLEEQDGIRAEGILLAKGVRSSLWRKYRKRPLDSSGNPDGVLYTP